MSKPSAAFNSGKILSRDALLAARARARAQGQRVVQCHGCFDIVHPGHIRHLRFARSQGDVLLVTITGDQSVDKGAGRPLIPQELRAENLAELDCVDWVYVEPRPTAVELLEDVQPDVYIKGREYEFNRDPRFQAERRAVECHGGRVVFSSGDVVFSSTALIEAMEAQSDPFQRRLAQLSADPELDLSLLGRLIDGFRGRRVVVVGEVVQDTYVFCDRPELADESPIMTLRPVRHQYFDGGAAILARHLAGLGAQPTLVTAMPRSELSDIVRSRLSAAGVDVRAIRVSTPLAEKQRLLVGSTKMMKLDLVEPVVLDAQQREELIGLATDAVGGTGADAGIIHDQGLGLLSPAMTRRLCRALRPSVGVLAGDVCGRKSSLRAMHAMDVLCPAESQVREAYRNFGDGLPAVTWELLEETQTHAAIVTLGAEGAIGFRRLPDAGESAWQSRLHGEHIPALVANPADAMGCGDAMLASATLALASGGSLTAATLIGSAASAIHARRIGNVPIEAVDLRRELQRVMTARIAYVGPETVSPVSELRSAS